MPPVNPSVNSGKLARKSDKPLDVHYKVRLPLVAEKQADRHVVDEQISSEKGLSSISTLIVGAEACMLIVRPKPRPSSSSATPRNCSSSSQSLPH